MAKLFNLNQTRTESEPDRIELEPGQTELEPGSMHRYDAEYHTIPVWYRNFFIFFNNSAFQTIFNSWTVPSLDWYGTVHPEPGSLGRFRDPWYKLFKDFMLPSYLLLLWWCRCIKNFTGLQSSQLSLLFFFFKVTRYGILNLVRLWLKE